MALLDSIYSCLQGQLVKQYTSEDRVSSPFEVHVITCGIICCFSPFCVQCHSSFSPSFYCYLSSFPISFLPYFSRIFPSCVGRPFLQSPTPFPRTHSRIPNISLPSHSHPSPYPPTSPVLSPSLPPFTRVLFPSYPPPLSPLSLPSLTLSFSLCCLWHRGQAYPPLNYPQWWRLPSLSLRSTSSSSTFLYYITHGTAFFHLFLIVSSVFSLLYCSLPIYISNAILYFLAV